MTNTSGVYDVAMVSIMKGLVAPPLVTSGTTGVAGCTCMLTTAQPTQGLATCTYSVVESQMGAVNGYAAGGQLIWTNVPTNSTHVTGLITNGSLVYSTTATIAATWLVPQYSATVTYTTSTNPLLCFLNMGAQSVTNGTLTIAWNGSGIFTLTVAAAS